MLKTIKLLLILSVFTYAANDVLYTPKSKVFDFTFNDINKNAQATNTQKVVPKVSYEISSMLGLFPRLFKIKNCPSDSFGNDYCPDSLAEANEEWDYEDGFSVSGVGNTTNYRDKESSEIKTYQPLSWILTYSYSYWLAGGQYLFLPYGIVLHNWKRAKQAEAKYAGQSIRVGNGTKTIQTSSNRLVLSNSRGGSNRGTVYLYSKGCNNGFIQAGGQCEKTVVSNVCPTGYIETIGEETTKGECKITIDYKYYEYKCRNEPNSQGYTFSAVNSGGDCNPLSTNDLIDSNNDGIGDSCNMSSPPNNNCLRKKFLCQFNENRPPVWIDNKWQCSPFPCNADKQCGTAICKNYPPSTEYYMSYSMHPIRAKFDGTCNTSICDSVKNNKMSYCESESCPTNAGVYKKNGRCYYDDCPVGTTINTRDQCIEDVN